MDPGRTAPIGKARRRRGRYGAGARGSVRRKLCEAFVLLGRCDPWRRFPVAVRFTEPQFGVSPGQACVFYAPDDGARLLGGGWIARKAVSAAA